MIYKLSKLSDAMDKWTEMITWNCSSSNSDSNAVSWITNNSAIDDKPRDMFRGQSTSPNTVPFHMLDMISYYCAIVALSVMRYSTSKNAVTLKIGLRVHEGHWNVTVLYSLWLPIDILQ